jgi:hypothetical protein
MGYSYTTPQTNKGLGKASDTIYTYLCWRTFYSFALLSLFFKRGYNGVDGHALGLLVWHQMRSYTLFGWTVMWRLNEKGSLRA